jgi:transcriptional regulator of heat shock response
MEQTFLDLVLNGGPLGLFAGYLIFQTKSMQKRFDAMSEKSESREDDLRARYDKVITDLQSEKSTIQAENQQSVITLTTKLDLLERNLTELEKKLDRVILSLDNMSQIVQELRMKDIARDTRE